MLYVKWQLLFCSGLNVLNVFQWASSFSFPHLLQEFNPLRAKFLRENKNVNLHFMSFLHTDKTQVVEILPWVRQGPAYST